MFLPLQETTYKSQHELYYSRWKLHFLNIEIALIDVDNMPLTEHEREGLLYDDRYVIMLTIQNVLTWFTAKSNDLEQITIAYKDIVNDLKDGESVEFCDLGTQGNKPIRLSWRAIEFEW